MPNTDKMAALVQLAGAVAHELNNIFTAVSGNLSLLDEHIERGSTPAEMIEEALRTAQRGIELSAKLQAFAGRQPLQRRQVNIDRVLQETVRGLRNTLPKAIEVGFVPANRDSHSYVDEAKLRSTIAELVANAVAAMNGVGRIHIAVEERRMVPGEISDLRAGDYVVIRVSDTGFGMAPEIIARAMDPMVSTKPSHINTGWGLSNSAGFMSQSGGTMRIFSEAGRGTAIDLYLPATAIAASSDMREAISA